MSHSRRPTTGARRCTAGQRPRRNCMGEVRLPFARREALRGVWPVRERGINGRRRDVSTLAADEQRVVLRSFLACRSVPSLRGRLLAWDTNRSGSTWQESPGSPRGCVPDRHVAPRRTSDFPEAAASLRLAIDDGIVKRCGWLSRTRDCLMIDGPSRILSRPPAQRISCRDIVSPWLMECGMLPSSAGGIAAAALMVWCPLILPAQSSLERLGAASSVAVGSIASVPLGTMRFATAVRSGGALRVAAWQLSSAGDVTETGVATGGDTDRIAAAQTGAGRLVTAVRTGNGDLRLITWHVNAAGAVMRMAQADAGRVEELSVTATDRTTIVTAVRDAAPSAAQA